ncbi:MAG TPA: TonB-dependent receptor [Chitinophagaceae bacterium]|nr:TonB-dependent receptor [Chitinophagaceae bacterium]
MELICKNICTALLFLAGSHLTAVAQTTSDTTKVEIATQPRLNIAYGQQSRRFVTSAISTVKGEDLQKTFNTNLGNTLYGRIAGLTVRQFNNEPGINSPGLNARGISTFNEGSNMLIIVDGFLGDYTQLVPEEIEEISLLKDAAATAIYGSRGANGVLLVTTKRGKAAPLTVNFSTQQGFSTASQLPQFLDSYNYATLYNEALANEGKPALYTQADLDQYRNGSSPYFRPNVNWYDEVLRKRAPVSNYNLSFRGGNETAKYFVLLNNINSQGLFKNFGDMDDESANSRYSRYNFRANIDVNLTRRLSATLLLGGTIEERANPSALSAGGIFNQLATLPPNSFPVRNPNGSFGGSSNFTNPVANLLKTGFAESNGRTIQSSFRLNHDLSMITDGLSASAAVSVNNYFVSGSNRTKSIERFAISRNTAGDTSYTRFGQTTSLSGSEPNLGQYRNYAIQGFLNYHRIFGRHDIAAMVMFNADNTTIDKRTLFEGTTDANLSLPYKNNQGGTRLTYVNNEKYIAEFSMAYMGSENYVKGNRYGYFPAGSIGWIISNEAFLKDNKAVTFLKLRASYGLTGNDQIGGSRFMFEQRYPFGSGYFFGTNNTAAGSLSEGRLANENVTWEKDKKANIGLDAGFGNQLDFSFDLFKQVRYDILAEANRTLPLFLGYASLPVINQGEVHNKGFEATLRYTSPEKKTIRFFAESNVFYARNKIINNAQPIELNPGLVREGRRLGQNYGLRALGLFQTDAEAAASPRPPGLEIKAGDIKYQDVGGPLGVPDGIIDGNDSQPIGNPELPELTVGLHTGLSFKGFDLDLMFQGVSGNSVYLGSSLYQPFQNFGQAGIIALERFTPQTAASASFPRLSASNNLNNYRFSSLYQRNGSFIKLRSAEIGYSLSNKITKAVRLQQARLFITGTNLFSIDHIKDGDPEALGTGYPALRTVTLGARLHF